MLIQSKFAGQRETEAGTFAAAVQLGKIFVEQGFILHLIIFVQVFADKLGRTHREAGRSHKKTAVQTLELTGKIIENHI